MKNQDQLYLMHTILLEVSIAENVLIDDIFIKQGNKNKNTYYILDKKTYLDKNKKTKVYFKKTF